MRRLTMIGMAFLAMIAMIFTSCEQNAGSRNRPNNGGFGVNFMSHPSATAVFSIHNETPFSLVAFRDNVSLANLLGGIPVGSQNHGIWRNPALFSEAGGAFTVVFVTYEQFLVNRDNLNVLNNTPFTRIFHVYTTAPRTFTISGMLGGQNDLVVQNQTDFGVELRIGGVSGSTLSFIPAGITTTTISVADVDFSIFPVFVTFNPVNGIVTSIFPQGPFGGTWFELVNFSEASPQVQTLSLCAALVP